MPIEIHPLAADDIECRIQSINESKTGKVGAILLLYKNARVDMRILDQVFGITGWQRSHEMIAGNLYCNIDIWDDEKGRWIRKQDVGTESNTEKEKGQASDAFKRAGFNIGIGRELYTAPFIYVPLEEGEYYRGKDGKWKCSPKTQFVVRHIEYNDRREITSIVICDNRGSVRFDQNKKHGNAEKPKQGDELQRYDMSEQKAPPPPEPPLGNDSSRYNTLYDEVNSVTGEVYEGPAKLVCSRCGSNIDKRVYDYSSDKYGRPLCRSCQKLFNGQR